MKKSKIIFVFLFIILSFGIKLNIIYGATNAGFVQANIWYSKDPFEEGDQIRIHTFVFNPDTRELSGVIEFLDNETILGKKSFKAPTSGIAEVSIPWTVTAGDHLIYAKIESAKFTISTGKYQDVLLSENETEKSKRFVAKKIVLNTNIDSQNNKTVATNTDTNIALTSKIDDITNSITDKTPTSITKPILSVTNGIEGVRIKTGDSLSNIEDSAKQELQKVNKDIINKGATTDKIKKPFIYVKLFLSTLFSAIFNSMILFYSLLFVIIFFFSRFLWRKFF
ncbi:MAG: hypothetical protein NTZ44_03700 [Candidatus Nomurabacteria bacterium]|nr:hypothetical protein [Candidatus Nomurabacteria bacterium]